MHSKPQPLPSLNALRAFEAAARLQSYARAAEELNVSSTAVSHQVRALEGTLCQTLFFRRNNSVSLTPNGAALAAVLTDSFGQISTGIQSVFRDRAAKRLTISAQPDFMLKWLMPRLKGFVDSHPDIDVEVVTTSRSLDLQAERIDLAIRYLENSHVASGSVLAGVQGKLQIDRLMGAELTPVLSPQLMARFGGVEFERILPQCRLLHFSGGMQDWSSWLDLAGIHHPSASRGLRFDSYVLSAECAIQGWGVALARTKLIKADLESGRLVAPHPVKLKGRRSWFIVSPLPTEDRGVVLLRQHLLSCVG